ncbi:hypothetical protein D3C80_802750 [compost metagenome]
MLEEAQRCINLHLAGFHVVFVHHAAYATVVVHVTVGVDHRHNGFFRPVLVVEVQRCLGSFGRNQRVEDGNAILALDDGHVRQVVVADLVDAVGDLEQARNINQLGLAPEARVGGLRCHFAFFDEGVLGRVPDHIARCPLERLFRQRGDKPFVGQFEGGLVVERQFLEQCIVGRLGGFRCRFWFL